MINFLNNHSHNF